MITYGGINHLSKIIGDLWIYDIKSQNFKNIIPFINNLGSIAFSAWCNVFYPRLEKEEELTVMENTGTIDWSKVTKFVSLLLICGYHSVSFHLLITHSLDMSIRNIYFRRKEEQNRNRQPALYLRFCI